jgi:hypothetical protein
MASKQSSHQQIFRAVSFYWVFFFDCHQSQMHYCYALLPLIILTTIHYFWLPRNYLPFRRVTFSDLYPRLFLNYLPRLHQKYSRYERRTRQHLLLQLLPMPHVAITATVSSAATTMPTSRQMTIYFLVWASFYAFYHSPSFADRALQRRTCRFALLRYSTRQSL